MADELPPTEAEAAEIVLNLARQNLPDEREFTDLFIRYEMAINLVEQMLNENLQRLNRSHS